MFNISHKVVVLLLVILIGIVFVELALKAMFLFLLAHPLFNILSHLLKHFKVGPF